MTRGVAFRDDLILITQWTLGASVSLNTDGDVALFGFPASSNGATQTIPSILSSTYPLIMLRYKTIGSGTSSLLVTYSSGSDTFIINPYENVNFTTATFNLTTNKTIISIKLYSVNATAVYVDFIQIFKETLTLPSVTRPIRMRKQRYLNKMQILQREGNIVQDLGSSSPEFDLSGSFITTSQYGADVWPQVLDGLVLESSTVQADGNPTWQWFSSDLYQRKVLVMDAMVEDVPGRQRATMNDYVLRLLQWDTIGQTTGALGAVS